MRNRRLYPGDAGTGACATIHFVSRDDRCRRGGSVTPVDRAHKCGMYPDLREPQRSPPRGPTLHSPTREIPDSLRSALAARLCTREQLALPQLTKHNDLEAWTRDVFGNPLWRRREAWQRAGHHVMVIVPAPCKRSGRLAKIRSHRGIPIAVGY